MYESVFAYDDFALSKDRKEVLFGFTIHQNQQAYNLFETYKFPVSLPDTLETYRLLRALHLASGISYYKIFYSAEIEHPYAMSTRESEMWNTIFKNGLGEFLYVNKLDAQKMAVFGPQEGHDTKTTARTILTPKALLGIGGGKDSIVAGELFKKAGIALDGFVLATKDATGQANAVTKTMKINLQVIERTIDAQLLHLQDQPGAYKGHIPISLLFALTGCLLAVANKNQYVVVANESSASIPRTSWAGQAVNHQWSKSFDFEQLLQNYIAESVSPDLSYFSAIRPLSSVAVSKVFASLPQYFEVFTSDNSMFKIDPSKRPETRWSLQSPKSLSSFILLAAWLGEHDLLTIFGRDFLNEQTLEPLFLSLLGLEGESPLDCVGTPEELRASLGQAFQKGVFKDSVLMQTALKYEIIAIDRLIAPTADTMLKLSSEQAFPADLSDKLMQIIQSEVAA